MCVQRDRDKEWQLQFVVAGHVKTSQKGYRLFEITVLPKIHGLIIMPSNINALCKQIGDCYNFSQVAQVKKKLIVPLMNNLMHSMEVKDSHPIPMKDPP